MPPKAPNQKRKRGRPSGASRIDQDASTNESPVATDEHDAEEEARPRKRGRKPRTERFDIPADSDAQDSPAQPARRGRPPKKRQQDAAGDTEDSPGQQQGKNTGRTAKGAQGESINTSKGRGKAAQSRDAQADDEVPSSEPRRSGRERRSWNPDEVFGPHRQTSSEQGAPDRAPRHSPRAATDTSPSGDKARSKDRSDTGKVKRKRGRPSLRDRDSGQGRALQPQQGNRAKAPGKASKQAQAAGAGGEGSQPRRRGRPKASNGPAEGSEDQDEALSRPKRKQAQSRRLEPVPEDAESSESDEEPELPFRHLREKAEKIPRSTISERWNPLDGPSINAVGTFLADAQRPVLLRLQDTNRRREHASSALTMISRRLRSKLVQGFPFPAPTAGAPTRAGSGTYDDEFDFERTVDAVQALESALNPLQHSVGLLEREIKREEDALARDYNSLHKLEANARSEAKRWREQTKREHVLVPGIKKGGEGGGDDGGPRDSLELVPRAEEDVPPGGLFKDLQDEELDTLAKQVGSHMESMKGNLQQIGGVVPAIARSKAALQQVLLKHLDDEQYERVLVG